jgi:competence ComEA-like helix-hairpin-helix protein
MKLTVLQSVLLLLGVCLLIAGGGLLLRADLGKVDEVLTVEPEIDWESVPLEEGELITGEGELPPPEYTPLTPMSDAELAADLEHFKTDINRAGVEELEELPGIGPSTVRRIVEFRSENGPFETIWHLALVKGISVHRVRDLREEITVGRPSPPEPPEELAGRKGKRRSRGSTRTRGRSARKLPPGTKININTADSATLQQLYRIGPATAAKIIAYREEHGPFRSIEQIMEVKGIGPATFDRIKDQITVE